MDNVATELNPQAVWDELAAEHAGQPAMPAKVEPTPAPVQAAVEPQPAGEEKPDPLAQIQAQIAELQDKFGGRLRNVEGHIGSLNGTQKELKALVEASKSASAQVDQAPTQTEIKQAAGNPAEWDALKADYPEWAHATEKLLDARISSQGNGFDAKAFEANIKEQMRGETEAVRKEIIDSSLDAVFPGWKEDIRSESFRNWQAKQPENVQALFNSDKVADAAKMLKMFEAAKQSDPAAQVIAQRQKNLAAASGTPQKGVRSAATPQKSWDDMSATERWDYEKRAAAKRKT